MHQVQNAYQHFENELINLDDHHPGDDSKPSLEAFQKAYGLTTRVNMMANTWRDFYIRLVTLFGDFERQTKMENVTKEVAGLCRLFSSHTAPIAPSLQKVHECAKVLLEYMNKLS